MERNASTLSYPVACTVDMSNMNKREGDQKEGNGSYIHCNVEIKYYHLKNKQNTVQDEHLVSKLPLFLVSLPIMQCFCLPDLLGTSLPPTLSSLPPMHAFPPPSLFHLATASIGSSILQRIFQYPFFCNIIVWVCWISQQQNPCLASWLLSQQQS